MGFILENTMEAEVLFSKYNILAKTIQYGQNEPLVFSNQATGGQNRPVSAHISPIDK
jgi:hypothetical protein